MDFDIRDTSNYQRSLYSLFLGIMIHKRYVWCNMLYSISCRRLSDHHHHQTLLWPHTTGLNQDWSRFKVNTIKTSFLPCQDLQCFPRGRQRNINPFITIVQSKTMDGRVHCTSSLLKGLNGNQCEYETIICQNGMAADRNFKMLHV